MGTCILEFIKGKGGDRSLVCTKCGEREYPKISPAVIVAIKNGEKLLMSRYAGRTHRHYALIAGFLEVGETLEDCVRREVMEEEELSEAGWFTRDQVVEYGSCISIGHEMMKAFKDVRI